MIRLNKMLLGGEMLEGKALSQADVDADGMFSSTDSLLILKYAISLIDAFPAEETS